MPLKDQIYDVLRYIANRLSIASRNECLQSLG